MSLSSQIRRIAVCMFVIALFSVTKAWAQSWIQLAPVGTPPSCAFAGFFDPATNRMVCLGLGDPNSLWLLSNANGLGGTPAWLQLVALPDPTQGFPTAKKAMPVVYDATNNRMIMFGGCLASCGSPVNDVWVLSNANGLGPPTWLKLFPTGALPPPSAEHAAVYDSTSNKMIVFGGTNGCCATPPTFSAVWVLSNANGLGGTPTWTMLNPLGGPPPGQNEPTAVYDSASNRMTVFGGLPNLSNTPTNAVWVLSNANGSGGVPAWTNLIAEGSTGSPPARFTHTAVYDPSANRMTIFGGFSSNTTNSTYNDTWVLTNANGTGAAAWTQLHPTGGPPAGKAFHVAGLDVASNRMIISGGENSTGNLTDTWVLTNANGIATSADAAITATGVTFNATEGQPFAAQTVASFHDPDTMSTAAEYNATIDWGDGSSSPPPPVTITPTGVSSSGNDFAVKGGHTYTEEGTYTVRVTITDVDNPQNTATATSTANVGDAALHSSCATAPASTQSFSGPTATFTDDNVFATKADFTAYINWGDGTSSAGTISGGAGAGPYTVSGNHTYSTTGTFTIITTINDDGGARTIASCQVIVFAFPTATGSFVIGDQADPSPIVGDSVTWWSSQWAQLNPMSGGPAPASMKGFSGFEDNLLGLLRTCGSSWTTDTGNATPPPPSVPPFMGVLVSSRITQNGSVITGNIKQVVVVHNNPGYAPDPGNPGTGTIVAVVCVTP